MHSRGCPICGYDYSTWSLIGQTAHLHVEHSWWQRLKLWWRVGSLRRMVIERKRFLRGETDGAS